MEGNDDVFSEPRAGPSLNMSSGLRITGGLPANFLLGRWRLCLELFGRVFLEDVGAEPLSVLNELGRFDVKEVAFRREMDRLKNTSQRDFTLEVRCSHCLLQTFSRVFFFPWLIFLSCGGTRGAKGDHV